MESTEWRCGWSKLEETESGNQKRAAVIHTMPSVSVEHPASIIFRRNSTHRSSSRLTIGQSFPHGVAGTSRMKRCRRNQGSCQERSGGGTGMVGGIVLPLHRSRGKAWEGTWWVRGFHLHVVRFLSPDGLLR
jgi:hypothetical protein